MSDIESPAHRRDLHPPREARAQSQLRPIHKSYRALLGRGFRIKPHAMERMTVSVDQFATLQCVAHDIFADCCNAGVPFQEALAAIYLSGLQHGQELSREIANG